MSINNQMCVLKTIWFNEIGVCVSWYAIHLLNKLHKGKKCVIKVMIIGIVC